MQPEAHTTTSVSDITIFKGFSSVTLLEEGSLPFTELAELAIREGQRTNDLFRVHRWFARRLTSQFRAILTALTLQEGEAQAFWPRYLGDVDLADAVVLDPFVGGGTSVVEASRCDAKVIGYDIDPVATWITRFELKAATFPTTLSKAVAEVCGAISSQITPLHKTLIGETSCNVLHHFWVETQQCDRCGAPFDLHPHFRLAYDKEKKVQWAFCARCYQVQELPLSVMLLSCNCGYDTEIDAGPAAHGKVECPECRTVRELAHRGKQTGDPPTYRLFAQEYLYPGGNGRTLRKFKAITQADLDLYRTASDLLVADEAEGRCITPERRIPRDGRADQRPLIHGIGSYRNLFNDRQLLHLTLLGRRITDMPNDQDKEMLSLAFSEHLTTNCLYTSYAFGYRRVSQALSMHAFRHITRPVELNPWLSKIGRGTFPNALDKVIKAIRFAKAPSDLDPKGGRTSVKHAIGLQNGSLSTQASNVVSGCSAAAIITTSSIRLEGLPDCSVDLVLTDPPYFNNISYSELSDFWLYWHQALGVAEAPYDDVRNSGPLQQNMAAPDDSLSSREEYRASLLQVLRECVRVLRPKGMLVFTYHHRTEKAWGVLGEALADSGLKVTKVLPLRGEGQGGLVSHEGTIKWDAVFACRPSIDRLPQADIRSSLPLVIDVEKIDQSRNLVAVYANAISDAPNIGFRSPDRLNLFRAFLISYAYRGVRLEQNLILHDALMLDHEKRSKGARKEADLSPPEDSGY